MVILVALAQLEEADIGEGAFAGSVPGFAPPVLAPAGSARKPVTRSAKLSAETPAQHESAFQSSFWSSPNVQVYSTAWNAKLLKRARIGICFRNNRAACGKRQLVSIQPVPRSAAVKQGRMIVSRSGAAEGGV
jgi:hypothetical protein